MQKRILFLFFLLLPCSIVLSESKLGKIHFPTSGKPQAQEHFLRGALLLHSFEYEDAREEFLQAEKLDSGFAMAYWGEAMTYDHPIWMEQDTEKGRAALRKLGETPEARLAKAPTAREKDYLRTIEVLYGEGDKKSRDYAYEAAMRTLAEKYPEDHEAKVFYALSILGTSHEGRDFRKYIRAAGVLEEIMMHEGKHPGVLHYLIHCYDDPIHAPLGLRPARLYASVAPAASHAQHMPSHIFLALGMWDDVISSNQASWKVAEERVRRKSLDANQRNYHALFWLQYAYLQKGQFEEAEKLLSIMENDTKTGGSIRQRSHLAMMRAAQIVETKKWDSAAVKMQIDTSGLSLGTTAADLFASGMAAVKRGDTVSAQNYLTQLEEKTKASASTSKGSHHGSSYSPTEQKSAKVMMMELEALILFAANKKEEAAELMEQAISIEEQINFDFGPPEIVKPSHELYGEMLLDMGRKEEAATQFQLALARAPGRLHSLRTEVSSVSGRDAHTTKALQERR